MTTIPTINTDHFRGHKNLNEGQRNKQDAILAEILAAVKVDIQTLEAIQAGLQDPKDSVRLATTAALPACTASGNGEGKTLTADANGALEVDNVTPIAADTRILVQNQVAGKDNGIFDLTDPGSASTPWILTRSTDADSSAKVTPGMTVGVEKGTVNADKIFMITTDSVVLDTTAITFEEISGIPTAHAISHVAYSTDEINGDQLDIDYTPTDYTPTTDPPEVHHEDHLTSHLAGINNEFVDVVQMEGSAAVVLLVQSGQPVANDTLDIGADTYEFDGVGGNINVTIGGDAETTLDNLISAINTSGTENLAAIKSGTTIAIIRSATAPGGTVVGADPDIALDASSATNYAFNEGDVNMNTLGGVAATKTATACAVLTITTAMITATTARLAFPFTPRGFTISATSSGVPVAFTTDTAAISGDDIVLGLGTDLANGDVVTVIAFA